MIKALGKCSKLKELVRYYFLGDAMLTLEKGWGLQMPISIQICPLIKPQDRNQVLYCRNNWTKEAKTNERSQNQLLAH